MSNIKNFDVVKEQNEHVLMKTSNNNFSQISNCIQKKIIHNKYQNFMKKSFSTNSPNDNSPDLIIPKYKNEANQSTENCDEFIQKKTFLNSKYPPTYSAKTEEIIKGNLTTIFEDYPSSQEIKIISESKTPTSSQSEYYDSKTPTSSQNEYYESKTPASSQNEYYSCSQTSVSTLKESFNDNVEPVNSKKKYKITLNDSIYERNASQEDWIPFVSQPFLTKNKCTDLNFSDND
jgi:hypothetical protein